MSDNGPCCYNGVGEGRYKAQLSNAEKHQSPSSLPTTRDPVRIMKVQKRGYAALQGLTKGSCLIAVAGPGLDDGLPLDVSFATLR